MRPPLFGDLERSLKKLNEALSYYSESTMLKFVIFAEYVEWLLIVNSKALIVSQMSMLIERLSIMKNYKKFFTAVWN